MGYTYTNCKFCKSLNNKDNNYCKNCGHKFGCDDLDREFRAGKLEALTKFNKHILTWLSFIAIFITIVSFLGFSKIEDVYKNELKDIKKEKEELEKTYKELRVVTNDLNTLMGYNGKNSIQLSNIIRILGVNFYSIRDIYIQARYKYKELDEKFLVKPYYSIIDLKKSDNSHLVEFKVDNLLRIGKNELLIKYKPFQFFESDLISKKLSLLNTIESIKFRVQHKVRNEYRKDFILRTLATNNQIENITLDIYVNSTLFWSLNVNNPRKYDKVLTQREGNSILLTNYTEYFNFKNEFSKSISDILTERFEKVIKKGE